MGQPETGSVFLRRASGVVRAMSPYDGMLYGYLSATGIYGLLLFFFIGSGLFPNANFLLANLISIGFFLAIYVVYAILASSMPRSGGDYVFTSRLLTPNIGWTVAQAGWIFWQFWFAFLAATVIVTGVIAPMFSAIGVASGTHFWIDAADQVQKAYIRLPLVVLLVVGAGWIMVSGMKYFTRLQRYFMMPASIIGVLIIAISFIFVSRHTFFSHFDSFQGDVGGLKSDQVVAKANALGFSTSHSSLFDTLAMSVNLSFLYVWTIWSSELLGEIKNANRVRSVFSMFFGAGILQLITFMVGITWAYSYIGGDFMKAFSWMTLNNPDVLGGSWDFRGAATVFYLPVFNIGLGILLFVCFLGPVSQSLFNTQLSASRFMLAMSFDRLLPSWLGRVNRRGVPHVAIWLGVGISVVLAILLELIPDLEKLLFWSSFATLFAILFSLIAGVVLPWRRKQIFATSPGSGWRVLGVPAITFFGVIGTAFILGSLVISLVHDGFGLLDPGAARVGLITFIALLVIAWIAFIIINRYRKSQGIEISRAFETIPPE